MFGSGAVASAGGLALGAGAAGYGVGTLISKAIEGTRLSDKIGESVARVLATFGSKEAKLALETNRSAKESLKKPSPSGRGLGEGLLNQSATQAPSPNWRLNQSFPNPLNDMEGKLSRAIQGESHDLANKIGEQVGRAISRTDKEAKVSIRITADGKPRVEQMSTKGLQLNVDSGLIGAAW